MQYIKIRILEFRDNQAQADLNQVAVDFNRLVADADDAARLASEIEALAKRSQSPADLELAVSQRAAAQALASSMTTARMKVKHASEANAKRARTHMQTGTFGYQEIDPTKMEVVRLLDEAGNPFPAGAVFCYEVADAEPLMPSWGIPDPESAPAGGPAVPTAAGS